MNDHELAAYVATEAGRLLVELRSRAESGELDVAQLRDAGDRTSHELIMSLLGEHRPADPVLSEEGKDDTARLEAPRAWVVDPLDGTREFGEFGRTDWAVHVALVEQSVPVAAAVALPARELTLSTAGPPGLARPYGGPPRVVVSRTRPPAICEEVRAALEGVLVPMGSAGAKAMSIVLGDADVYVHGGGQYEWDSCAPVGVATAAGLHTSRLDGSPLRYNQPDVWLPDLLICRAELASAVLAAVHGES
jgi:3'(2'), 5'-bisphosphate nucleotidase